MKDTEDRVMRIEWRHAGGIQFSATLRTAEGTAFPGDGHGLSPTAAAARVLARHNFPADTRHVLAQESLVAQARSGLGLGAGPCDL